MNENTKELHLLKQGKRGLMRVIFSRTGIILLLLALGIVFTVFLLLRFIQWLPHVVGAAATFQIFTVAVLINSRMDATAKITWLLVITIFPVVGGCFYFYTRTNFGSRAFAQRVNRLIQANRDTLVQDEETMENLRHESPSEAFLAQYIHSTGCFPVFANTDVKYYPSGEENWKDMLEDLRQAKSFIYLEYFIIQEGDMWGTILDILVQKAASGLDVRVMYDGTCEFSTLPHNYPKRLEKLGILCRPFAPMTPFLSTHYNYRDHRKILVIDGQIAHTGGINLADEYINHVERFGYWKDVGIRVEGRAAASFHLMFLEMWDTAVVDVTRFSIPETADNLLHQSQSCNGFVLPFGDNPFDQYKVGEQVYMDFLNRAEHYVHIMTPYLILDGELENALKFAAERGIDVKLIMPGIPDKKTVYILAKTYWPSLLDSGVKIYTYTPGFVHAKVFVADDVRAAVGTINLDYRSLYHHFECGAILYKTNCIRDIEKDFQETLKKCQRVTRQQMRKEKWRDRIMGAVLKGIAPLL